MHDLIDLSTRIGEALRQRRLMMATAESCTGGGIAYTLTEIPGSSDWFDCGFVTYSNAAKTELLDIPEATLAQFGAVSEEIAAAMAEGAVANSEASVAVSTTGIAGPGGAVPGKPVGTVCFGWHVGNRTRTERLVFQGNRAEIRRQTIAHALSCLLRYIDE